MNLRTPTTLVVLFLASISTSGSLAQTISMEMVTVGNPGNANDSTGYGGVPYEYRIGKYELTFGQLWGAGDSANLPVSGITTLDAVRLANWMHNGQGSGSTETGAYTIVTDEWGTITIGKRNPTARFYIPTENEWYKAAYYSPTLNGGSGGYWLYPTQSNTFPGNVVGSGSNQANIGRGNYVVGPMDVGSFTNSASYYGTFDQAGNLLEFSESASPAESGPGAATEFVVRGGMWQFIPGAFSPASTYRWTSISGVEGGPWVGVRLASPIPLVIAGSSTFPNETRALGTVEAGGSAEFSGGFTGALTVEAGGSARFSGGFTGSLTVEAGGSAHLSDGFTGSLTVNGGTATLSGTAAGTISIATGGAAAIAAGVDLNNAKLSLAAGATLTVARGAANYLPFAAGNIGGLTLTPWSGLLTTILSGSVETDSTIYALFESVGSLTDTADCQFITGEVLSFAGTGFATWTLQMQYDPMALAFDEAKMAADGNLFLAWLNYENEWVNAVTGNWDGTPQFFQRGWQPGDTVGSYGVDIASNTVWAVLNHNSEFAVMAVPEPTTASSALAGLVFGGYSLWCRRRRTVV